MNYTIRKSTLDDLPVILNLRDQACEIMRSYGNVNQWPEGYPPEEKFINDIEQGHSYIMTDTAGAIVGTFAFIPGPDITYHVIYDGILDAVLDYCEAIAPNIRIDTHKDNIIMIKGLEKRGYQYCGIIHLLNGDERLAFQKNVSLPNL